MDWLAPTELRVGLGCMRLSTDAEHDPERARATIEAAAAAGIIVFDTARAYGRDAGELGHNERLLADALRGCGAEDRARIVTKGGMARAGGAWVPDGRAKAIRSDCEASLAALGGLPIDTYLLHAPDPRTPWPTSVRALARLHADGLVARVGIANVNRRQLDEALELAPISAVQVALSVFDDGPVRGGLVARCAELGIALIAHSPLGGVRRAGGLGRRAPLTEVARRHGADAGRGGAGVAALALPRRRRDPRRPAARDGAQRGARGDPRPDRGRSRGSAGRPRPPAGPWAQRGRWGRRDRHGHSRRGQDAPGSRVRRAGL